MIDGKKNISAAQWGAIATIVAALIGLCGILVNSCISHPEFCGFPAAPTPAPIQTTMAPVTNTPTSPILTSTPPLTIMDKIYAALNLEDLVTDKAIYISGEEVVFSYKLTNRSNQTLVIPENNDYSQTFYLVGAEQRWIERLGSDDNIPSIPEIIARDGARYASGGEIIRVDYYLGKKVIGPAESIPFNYRLSTSGYPTGLYRFYVEYKKLAGEVIQTLSVDFEIR